MKNVSHYDYGIIFRNEFRILEAFKLYFFHKYLKQVRQNKKMKGTLHKIEPSQMTILKFGN